MRVDGKEVRSTARDTMQDAGTGRFRSSRKLLLSAGLLLLFSGCSLPGITLFGDADPGQQLVSNERVALHFFTKEPNFDTGVNLQAGNDYRLGVTVLSLWVDSYIEENEHNEPLDERGFDNSVMPLEWLGVTRRSRQHNWFELMLYQPNCKRESLQGVSELEVDERGGYRFVAACDGKLTLFVNDTHGFYGNNVGYANLSLSRVN